MPGATRPRERTTLWVTSQASGRALARLEAKAKSSVRESDGTFASLQRFAENTIAPSWHHSAIQVIRARGNNEEEDSRGDSRWSVVA